MKQVNDYFVQCIYFIPNTVIGVLVDQKQQ